MSTGARDEGWLFLASRRTAATLDLGSKSKIRARFSLPFLLPSLGPAGPPHTWGGDCAPKSRRRFVGRPSWARRRVREAGRSAKPLPARPAAAPADTPPNKDHRGASPCKIPVLPSLVRCHFSVLPLLRSSVSSVPPRRHTASSWPLQTLRSPPTQPACTQQARTALSSSANIQNINRAYRCPHMTLYHRHPRRAPRRRNRKILTNMSPTRGSTAVVCWGTRRTRLHRPS